MSYAAQYAVAERNVRFGRERNYAAHQNKRHVTQHNMGQATLLKACHNRSHMDQG